MKNQTQYNILELFLVLSLINILGTSKSYTVLKSGEHFRESCIIKWVLLYIVISRGFIIRTLHIDIHNKWKTKVCFQIINVCGSL